MRSFKPTSLSLALMLWTSPALVVAAPVDDLIASARLWQAKNQPELARLAVAKALSADPGNAQALLMQAQLDIRAGNRQLLQQRLAALQRLHPASAELRQLQAQMRLEQSGDARLFSGAQSMARAGRADEAVATVRRIFPEGPPGGDLSLQYYQILAAAPASWQEAATGLQRLVAESPRDPRYQLALARLLVQREATRLRGVQLLGRLSAQGSGDMATLRATWRQALLQLAPGAASLASIDVYLAVESQDADVRRWRAELAQRMATEVSAERARHDPGVIRREQLLAALDSGRDLAATEQGLLALATERPRDGDVQGGLGRLLMRQGRHDEAVAYFTRAAALDAGARGKWLDLAATARFWGLLRQVRDQRDAGAPVVALRDVDAALRLRPRQPDALSLRAGLLADQGQDARAEADWRAALTASPGHEASLEGLATLLARQGRTAELARLLPARGGGRLQENIDRARASQMRGEADDLVAAGQREDAMSLLRQAVGLDPANPWLRYDLARQLRQAGRTGDADEVAAPLLAADAQDLSGSRYAYALYAASLDRTTDALAALESIPEAERSGNMGALAQRLRLDLALAGLGSPDPAQAAAARAQARQLSAGDPELSYRLARELVRTGQPAQAAALMDAGVTTSADTMRTAWQLRQAALLDQIGDDAALTPLLARLQARPQDLTDAQHAGLRQLQLSQRLRAVDALAARGDHAGAGRLLDRALLMWPDEPSLRLRQAALDVEAGRTDRAVARYRALLQRKPGWDDAELGLIDAYITGERPDDAKAALQALEARTDATQTDMRLAIARRYQRVAQTVDALRLFDGLLARQPVPAPVLIGRGELAEALGEHARSRDWYERALAAEGRPPLTPAQIPVESEFARSPAERALSRLEKRRDGYVQTGVIYRDKQGEDGLSTTTVTEMPTELYLPLGYEGHVIGHLDLIEMDAGRLPVARRDQAEFGQVLAKSPAGVAVTGQSASGMALGLGYETDDWRFDLGTTPLGFLVTNWVGGLRYSSADASHYRSAELFRRPVTSSLLSYGGQRDPASGQVWGGVTSTGGSFRVSHSQGGRTRAIGGRAALLRGRAVMNNSELRLTASQIHDLVQQRDMELTLGLAATYWRFQRDLSNFTYGQGGYYSPQQYVSLSLPLRWTGRWHDYAYRFEPAVGVSWSKSDATPFHPTDSALQAQAEANAAADPGLPFPVFSGSSGSSFGYTLEGAVEKRLAPNWFAGAAFRLDRSPYYTPNVFQVYMRYELKPKQGLVEYPPRLLRPYSEF